MAQRHNAPRHIVRRSQALVRVALLGDLHQLLVPRNQPQLGDTALRLYEVVDLSPGVSLTLRDVERGSRRTVHERLGSRAIPRATLLAARVIDPGASGQPEIERGLLSYPDLVRDSVKSQLSALRQRLRDEGTLTAEAEIDEHTGLFLHDAWMSCLLDPPMPRLKTTDGEDLLLTSVRFDVDDEEGLAAALNRGGELASEPGEPGVWYWSGRNREGGL